MNKRLRGLKRAVAKGVTKGWGIEQGQHLVEENMIRMQAVIKIVNNFNPK